MNGSLPRLAVLVLARNAARVLLVVGLLHRAGHLKEHLLHLVDPALSILECLLSGAGEGAVNELGGGRDERLLFGGLSLVRSRAAKAATMAGSTPGTECVLSEVSGAW